MIYLSVGFFKKIHCTRYSVGPLSLENLSSSFGEFFFSYAVMFLISKKSFLFSECPFSLTESFSRFLIPYIFLSLWVFNNNFWDFFFLHSSRSFWIVFDFPWLFETKKLRSEHELVEGGVREGVRSGVGRDTHWWWLLLYWPGGASFQVTSTVSIS